MFSGTYTAIVTPFNQDGSVDYGRLRALVDAQAEAGIAGVVPVGTTGESPTLTYAEHNKVVAETVAAANGRMTVIAGTGANSTDEALELTRDAMAAGADASLQITPYYNKPTNEGLYRHFSAIADLGLPVMLYNAPGRTSREIPVSVIKRLASHPNIVAVKEAAGDAGRVSEILAVSDLEVLSGDDSLTLPMMAIGAVGVVSVASNVIPARVVEMVNLALAGDFKAAAMLHHALYKFFSHLFIEVNPVPVKAALAMLGQIEETYRLPMCEMQPENKAVLAETMKQIGLI